MSIDPNKAFGMKAANKTYTLEFKKESNGYTQLEVVDGESKKFSLADRINIAWKLVTGRLKITDLVFPISLRNSDFYHMSYIYRPVSEKNEETVQAPKAKREKAEGDATKPKRSRPKKTREVKAD